MADSGLKQPVEVQAGRIDATILPPGFSQALKLYLIQQGLDFTKVAGKANEAGAGAYTAQETNDSQDKVISNISGRIDNAELEISEQGQKLDAAKQEIELQGQRITDSEQDITSLESNVQSLSGSVSSLGSSVQTLSSGLTQAQKDITRINGDFVSKTVPTTQTLASPLSVTTSYSISGVQVVGARDTGWTTSAGFGYKGAFDANLFPAISATYVQAEQQAMREALVYTRQRVKALEDALRAHGLIGA